ncbi:MAG: hypothetical protein QNJ46_15910 [Leptolyngbyaceae cyanobacterium MO_188.B28]|nr:hypothetical protein [Leptolyngbyaceae cyanobacterium MO_188.B28]
MKTAALALSTLLTLGVAAPAYAEARIVFSSSNGRVQVVIGDRHRHRHSHGRRRYYRRSPYYRRHHTHYPSRRYRIVRSRRYPHRYYRVHDPYHGRHPVHYPYRYDD